MFPIEIIAYTTGDGEQKLGDYDVLEGTAEELAFLRKMLIDGWYYSCL